MGQEVVEALAPWRGGVYVDATLGGGGHSLMLLRAAQERGARIELIGLDRDKEALAAARDRLAPFAEQLRLIESNYRHLPEVLEREGIGPVDGLVLDAGVSSHQLDTARRGFSFQQEGPLDMRMGDSGATAAEVLDALSEEELSLVLHNYGEVRGARRLAARIKEARRRGELETTHQLAALCGKPHPKKKVHPATLVFQALRIQVNDELGGLEELVRDLGRILKPGGRCAIISFHSLEDRIVKHGMRLLERGPQQDPNAMFMAPGPAHQPVIKTLGGVIRPSEQETQVNPRARSARLRVAQGMVRPGEAS